MTQEIEKILGSEVLSEDVKQGISEAWEAQIAEARENITAELREEFAGRYENDKTHKICPVAFSKRKEPNNFVLEKSSPNHTQE